jgi:hypothetical protein
VCPLGARLIVLTLIASGWWMAGARASLCLGEFTCQEEEVASMICVAMD